MNYYQELIEFFSSSKVTGANNILKSIIEDRFDNEGKFIYPYYIK